MPRPGLKSFLRLACLTQRKDSSCLDPRHPHHPAPTLQPYQQRLAAATPTSRRSVTAAERAGAYYQEVLAPLGVEHFLYAIVRHQGVALGQLSLYRGPSAQPFSEADEATLAEVLHYLGEALAVPTPTPASAAQEHVVEEGLAVLDEQGRELFADAHWPRLVRLAQGDVLTPARAHEDAERLPRFVASLLAAIVASPQAVHRVDSAWGQFAFRRHHLSSAQGAAATALLVSRLSVEPLRLAEGAAALGLSPQQREVAVMMAQGHSNQAIAEHMGVSLNTASYHVKQVFQRLDVHERTAVAKLLAQAAGTQL
ncbi:MAG: hypothetical protein C4K60_00150 [Ideonella sp. MAG2]|nr:MAG: hypothetical protein C4K60_00150 [Ideonella sp. MAG2]